IMGRQGCRLAATTARTGFSTGESNMSDLTLTPAVAAALQRWHGMVERRDLSELPSLLDEQVVFRSPMAHTPYPGVQVVSTIMGRQGCRLAATTARTGFSTGESNMSDLTLTPAVAAALQRWHGMVERRDLSELPSLLDEQVVFRSPMAHTPYPGVQVVSTILS